MSQAPQTLSPSAIAARESRYRRRNTHTEGLTEPPQTSALKVLMLASVLLFLPGTFVVPGQLVLPTFSLLALALAVTACAAAWSMNLDKSNCGTSAGCSPLSVLARGR